MLMMRMFRKVPRPEMMMQTRMATAEVARKSLINILIFTSAKEGLFSLLCVYFSVCASLAYLTGKKLERPWG